MRAQLQRQFQRMPLRVRLLALTAVPVVGMSAFAGGEAAQRFETVSEVHAANRAVTATLELLDLRLNINYEHLTSLGSVRAVAFGVNPFILRTMTGIDLTEKLGRFRGEVNTSAKKVQSSDGSQSGLDSQSKRAVAKVLSDLQRIRAVVDNTDRGPQAAAQRGRLDADFAAAEDNLQTVIQRQVQTVRRRIGSSSNSRTISEILDVNDAYLDYVQAGVADFTITSGYVLGAQFGTRADRVDVARAEGRVGATLARLEQTLTPSLRIEWKRVLNNPIFASAATVRKNAFDRIAAARTASSGGRKPTALPSVAGLDITSLRSVIEVLQTEGDSLTVVGHFGPVIAEQIRAETNRVVSGSLHAFRMAVAAAVTLVALTLLFALLTARSIVGPLRRLERHARTLSAGDLSAELVGGGPPEIGVVGRALDDLAAWLGSLSAQADALSRGALDAPILAARMPGLLGESLGLTVDRWKVLTNELQASEARASAIVDHAADAIWMLDPQLMVLEANTAAEDLMDTLAGDQVGTPFLNMLDLRPAIMALEGSAIAAGLAMSVERRVRKAGGRMVSVLLSSSRVETESGTIIAVFAHDISERKLFEDRLSHQASHDALTGLMNRAAAMKELDRALEDGERLGTKVAVMFLDLDGFKDVNDAHGHRVGDELLTQVAERLNVAIRGVGSVARFGGDEFMVVVGGIADARQAVLVGDCIIADMVRPFMVDKRAVSISASIGVAIGRSGVTSRDLLHEADVAVYEAKARGRSRVVLFDAALQRWIDERGELERDLRHGIANGELTLHYQPIMDLSSDTCWGVEALVRWNRPGHGLLAPGDFVAVAEESLLIVELGRWVIDAACKQLQEWAARPGAPKLCMAVNVSGRHLTDADLLGDVCSALHRYGIDPSALELEITETHLLRDIDPVVEVLTQLRNMGVGLAIDDFGTGYSSLTYLRRFPVDTMKIDRSFVAEIGRSHQDTSLVEQLLMLAEAMHLQVVAEGIETPEQLAALRAMGCEFGQGYLFARPLPPHELAPLLFDAKVEMLSQP